jgi:predicted membrane channel-forming protein YqfA (hemolysin III family)
LNNWRAAGYIFLGWGSVFLIYALIVFLSLTSIFSAIPSLAQATIALAANVPWLIIASLAYVNGVVCYYAGRENAATSVEANLEDTLEYVSQPVSSKIDSLWSFPVSVTVGESYEIKRVDLDFFTEE